jgi:hypothetical protein
MKSAIFAGGFTYAAARFIFDRQNKTSLIWAAVVGGIAFYLANQTPASYNPAD